MNREKTCFRMNLFRVNSNSFNNRFMFYCKLILKNILSIKIGKKFKLLHKYRTSLCNSDNITNYMSNNSNKDKKDLMGKYGHRIYRKIKNSCR